MGGVLERSVWVIGLMGAGKSTVGRALAARTGVAYLDNDATIAELAGTGTLELSQAGGELLHAWEARYVRELTGRPGPVVAGIAASSADRPDDLALLRAHGFLVHLSCDVATLLSRVSRDPARPWLHDDAEATLQAMHDRREPVLRAAAHLVLDGTRTPQDLVDDVLAAIAPGQGVSRKRS